MRTPAFLPTALAARLSAAQTQAIQEASREKRLGALAAALELAEADALLLHRVKHSCTHHRSL